MKKLWLMLLIGCTVGTLSACSEKEDNPKPQNPITEVSVPATAEIGGFYTVTGKGFATSAQLYLRNASGVETATTDPTVASTGITVTIPSTLTAGVYTVLVKQDGSWDLGSVRLEAAQNPVSSVELPEVIKLNKTLEIAGNGFTADSKIFLESADAAKTRTELTTTVSPTGVNCAIPSGVAAGTYNVILKHNNIDWTLGENIPAAVYKRIKTSKSVMSMGYTIKDEAGLRAALKADGATDEEIDNFINSLLGQSMELPVNDLNFEYDSEGRISKIVSNEMTDQDLSGNPIYTLMDWFTFAHNDNTITGTYGLTPENTQVTKFVWKIADGAVEASDVTRSNGKNASYVWNYTEGYCTSITLTSAYKTFAYDAGNFMGEEGMNAFEYKNAALKNNVFGIDMSKAMYYLLTSGAGFEDDHLIANYLNLFGKTSVNLPSGVADGMGGMVVPEYIYDAQGYVTSAKWGVEQMDPNDPMYAFVTMGMFNTVTCTYEAE